MDQRAQELHLEADVDLANADEFAPDADGDPAPADEAAQSDSVGEKLNMGIAIVVPVERFLDELLQVTEETRQELSVQLRARDDESTSA